MKKCGRCLYKNEVTEEEIEKMVSDVKSMRGARLVTDEEAARRLEICKACEKLEYGTTCMLCGCVMRVRTMLADGRCPYPRNGKW